MRDAGTRRTAGGLGVGTRYNVVVRNPWSELPTQSPYVLDIDRASIDKYNALHDGDEKIVVESLPKPFIGNPQSAKVVLLSLSPGPPPITLPATTADGLSKVCVMHV